MPRARSPNTIANGRTNRNTLRRRRPRLHWLGALVKRQRRRVPCPHRTNVPHRVKWRGASKSHKLSELEHSPMALHARLRLVKTQLTLCR